MVVGKNLGSDSLATWLGEQGYPTEKLASAKGFRVLESRRAEPESVDQAQGLQRAGADGAPGMTLERCRDVRFPLAPGRERETPLVGGQQLRQQLGAGAVPVAAGPVNVHPHRRLLQVLLHVVREDAHRAGDERAVPSGCAHAPRPSTSARSRCDLGDEAGSGPRDRQPLQGVGEPRQSVDARAALAGTLPREVAGDGRGSASGQVSRSSTCTTPAPGVAPKRARSATVSSTSSRSPGTQAPW